MKKRIVSIALTVLMVVSMMYTAAFAVEPMANNAEEKKVYSVSIDANLLATGGSASGTISTIVLSLPGYSNGWSAGKDVKFSTIIPSNAVVESVEVTPGKLSAGSSTTSPVVTTKYAITSPSGKRVERTYKDTSEIMAFYGESARGTWTFQIYGTNVGPSYGTVNCTSSKITIWYTLE